MRALAVVVRGVAAEYGLEVAAADDQEPVEALGAKSADEALGEGVRLWGADRRVDHLDAFAVKDLVESSAEFAVAVMDQKPNPFEHAAKAEIASLLCHPCI